MQSEKASRVKQSESLESPTNFGFRDDLYERSLTFLPGVIFYPLELFAKQFVQVPEFCSSFDKLYNSLDEHCLVV
jgi:hypothetical protein